MTTASIRASGVSSPATRQLEGARACLGATGVHKQNTQAVFALRIQFGPQTYGMSMADVTLRADTETAAPLPRAAAKAAI